SPVRHPPRGWSRGRREPRLSSDQLDRVVLDHRVAEELPAHIFEAGLGLRLVGLVQLKLDVLALADIANFGEAQAIERMSDGLALGIEHAILEGYVNSGFHLASYCSVVGPRTSPGPWSIRMPSRRATSW